MGDYPIYAKIDPMTMVKGRWINDIDMMEKRKVCVIGEKVLESMFDKDEACSRAEAPRLGPLPGAAARVYISRSSG